MHNEPQLIFESLCKTGGCYANTVSQKSLSQGPYGGEPGALFKHDGRLFLSATARATVITSAPLNNWKVNHSIFFPSFSFLQLSRMGHGVEGEKGPPDTTRQLVVCSSLWIIARNWILRSTWKYGRGSGGRSRRNLQGVVVETQEGRLRDAAARFCVSTVETLAKLATFPHPSSVPPV